MKLPQPRCYILADNHPIQFGKLSAGSRDLQEFSNSTRPRLRNHPTLHCPCHKLVSLAHKRLAHPNVMLAGFQSITSNTHGVTGKVT
jgi:hypothetical protein